MSDFNKLASSNVRRLPVSAVGDEPGVIGDEMALIMRRVASEDVVRDVLIPRLKERIAQLDEDESEVLGSPKQYEIRGRRLEAKDELARWLEWSGQAKAPDKES